MKLVTFETETPVGRLRRLGALIDGDQDGRIADLTAAYATWLAAETDETLPRELASLRTPPDMLGWLRGGPRSREAAERALAFARARLGEGPDPRGLDGALLVYPAEAVRLLAPLPRPNSFRDCSIYQEHMSRAEPPFEKKPAWYTNPPYYKGSCDSIVGPGAPIPSPYYTQRLDLELEIGIVVGREGRNLSFEEAERCIAGYTILIDSSCRDGYEREPFGPNKRKDFNTVLGPCLVTPDEIEEGDLACRITVDGELWWEGNTGHRRSFTPAQLVAYMSDNETVFPGDLIGTGTVGLGCSMDLHKWPKVGARVRFEVEGIGRLEHEVVAGEHVVDHVAGMTGLLAHPGADAAGTPG